jgi:phosphatidylglycerol:prolipoprotein diacylglycerol transferase
MAYIPIEFHLGPLTLSLYGFGLAIAFVFGGWLVTRRLRAAGEPTDWVWPALPWVVASAIIGARLADVATHASAFAAAPLDIVAFWHGGITGLSSFGGILFAVPTAVIYARRHVPGLRLPRTLDAAVPALVATWGLARLVACQVMLAGGGARTDAWYGMRYHGQIGRRVPVPLFQSAENWLIFAVLLLVERRLARGDRRAGVVAGLGLALWGLSRAGDEFAFFFTHPRPGTWATTLAGIGLAVLGIGLALWRLRAPVAAPDELTSAEEPGVLANTNTRQ